MTRMTFCSDEASCRVLHLYYQLHFIHSFTTRNKKKDKERQNYGRIDMKNDIDM